MVNRIQKRWTLDELYSLPDDGNSYELIHGQLFVSPPPGGGHELVLARLTRLLDPYVAANDLGFVFHPRAAVTSGEETHVEPDLMVRQPADDPRSAWASWPLPILVVEVASDSTRRRDLLHKRTLYAELGIPEYWIVDGENRSVRVVRPGQPDVITTEMVIWNPSGVSTPLGVALVDVFGQPF